MACDPIHIPKNKPVKAIQLIIRWEQINPQQETNCNNGNENGKDLNDGGAKPIKEKPHFDLCKPLTFTLGSVLRTGGRMVLAFPDFSDMQVRKHVHNLNEVVANLLVTDKRVC